MKYNTINFVKMHASGNDFIIINNLDKTFNFNYSKLAKKLCERKFSVGADGLLVLEKSKLSDFKMLYFNSDGSKATMCGNGARCIAYYYSLIVKNKTVRTLTIETLAGIIKAEIDYRKNINTAKVKIQLTEPKDIKLNFMLKVAGKKFNASFINTGVPHTVIFVKNISKINVDKLGRIIRNNIMFQPEGTNVNFVEVKNNNTLFVRTYERGVESETYACGTGITASSIIAGLNNFIKPPVKCITSIGEILKVYYNILKDKNFLTVSNVYLEGMVHISFSGRVK